MGDDDVKLEAREKTGDILSDIDDLIDSVNHTSARMRFDNLLPTCEIGDEIGDLFVSRGGVWPRYLNFSVDKDTEERWEQMGRQRERSYCSNQTCECKVMAGRDEIPGISQPFILDDDEFVDFREDELDISENDRDALNYMINKFGRGRVAVSVGYGTEAMNVDDFLEKVYHWEQ